MMLIYIFPQECQDKQLIDIVFFSSPYSIIDHQIMHVVVFKNKNVITFCTLPLIFDLKVVFENNSGTFSPASLCHICGVAPGGLLYMIAIIHKPCLCPTVL